MKIAFTVSFFLVALTVACSSNSGGDDGTSDGADEAGPCGNGTGGPPVCTAALEGVSCHWEAAPCQPNSGTCESGQWVTGSDNDTAASCSEPGRTPSHEGDGGRDAAAATDGGGAG